MMMIIIIIVMMMMMIRVIIIIIIIICMSVHMSKTAGPTQPQVQVYLASTPQPDPHH